MKKFFLLLSLSIYTLLGLAQVDTSLQTNKQVKNILNQAQFIFEGKMIASMSYYNDSTKEGYTVNKIKIDKIFKGANELNVGTVEVVRRGAIIVLVNGRMMYTDVSDRIYPPGHAIYFCSLTSLNHLGKKQALTIDGKLTSNFQLYTLPTNLKKLRIINDIDLTTMKGLGQTFENNQAIYDFLAKHGYKIEKERKEHKQQETVKKKAITVGSIGSFTEKEKTKLYAQRMHNLRRYMQQLKAKLVITQKNSHKNKSTNDIIFSFANVQETGTSPHYLEFDVMVQANNNTTYFDNCLLYIAYNTAAFGSNIVANNKITITKGTTFNNATYIDPNANMIDTNSAVVGTAVDVPFGTDFNQATLNRTLLTTTPVQLLHFKIEIATCNQNSGIYFSDTSFTSIFSFYAMTANASITNTFSYDNTHYLNDISRTLCRPTITSFTPQTIYPGTYASGVSSSKYLLTINGYNFGTTRGNGNAYFKNADDGGSSYIALNASYDIQSWSNNQITIKMPSKIKYVDPFNNTKFYTPGSGIFYVKNDMGDSGFSSTPINMPYAVNNAVFEGPLSKVRYDLANIDVNDSEAIVFHLDTSISNHPQIADDVKKALRRWRCATLVYYEIGSDTTLPIVSDNISVIKMVDSFPNSGTLGQTTIWNNIVQCTNGAGGDKHVFPTEIDIAFLKNPTNPWYYDTLGALPSGKEDFYEAALHELGHAVLLEHSLRNTAVATNQDVMYYATSLGPIAFSQRKDIDASSMNGGFNIVQRGIGLNMGSYNCNQNIGTLYLAPDKICSVSSSIKKIVINDGSIAVYPNPTKGEFTIAYFIKSNTEVKITILNSIGKRVMQFDKRDQTTGIHRLKVDLSNVSKGLYFVMTNINGNLKTLKIIRQ